MVNKEVRIQHKDSSMLCCPWTKEPHRITNTRGIVCWSCGDELGQIRKAEIEVEQDFYYLCGSCAGKVSKRKLGE